MNEGGFVITELFLQTFYINQNIKYIKYIYMLSSAYIYMLPSACIFSF